MNIIFFGYTGLGSSVLRGLLKLPGNNITSVFTKKYDMPYPYYPEKQISEMCDAHGIKYFFDKNINSKEYTEIIMSENPDLIIVASFGTIISEKILNIPKLGIINFHPSLLPKYRGPYPDQAVLLNGEVETGITVHYVGKKIDSGNILIQKIVHIEEYDDYCSLKKKLAALSEETVPEVYEMFSKGNRPEGIIQDENTSTYFAKPSEKDCFLENESDFIKIKNKIRALNPFPGTSYLLNNRRIPIYRYELIYSTENKNGLYESEEYIELVMNSRGIRLYKKK